MAVKAFQDEQRALTMVYWHLAELKRHGVKTTSEARAILAGIRNAKVGRRAA